MLSLDEGEPHFEQEYIMNEVRTLVRKNRDLRSSELIEKKIQEFEARIVTGVHYKIPYPRPVNVVPGATGKDPEMVTPVYLDSYKTKDSMSSKNIRRRGPTPPVYEE